MRNKTLRFKQVFYLPSGRVFLLETKDKYLIECTEMRDVSVNGKKMYYVTTPENLAKAPEVELPGSEETVAAAGDLLWNASGVGYKYVRLVYTSTSGTGDITVARSICKGVE